MMPTKLEECARVIKELRIAERNLNDANLAVDGLWPDRTYQPSDDAIARAVIRCLMEVDDAMANAAGKASKDYQWQHESRSAPIGLTYRAMLQSVLDEGK